MKTFLVLAFLASVVVAFGGALTNQDLLYRLGAVLSILTLLGAYGASRLNDHIEGDDQ
ncbi:hypothetical protein [Leifsonia aquatica]|uniref:hypothetical protein n=1 Tax=Leifsonia aquatica TaxID=144185 RepID=UPI000ACCACDE|nr:hypothetical protein [Leifsonia aquatica]